MDVTDEWDVPLMVTRGYPSMSFLYSAADAIRRRSDNGQRTAIYYFGDRDPSGLDIDRAVVEGIGEALDSLPPSSINDLIFGDDDLTARDRFKEAASFKRVAVTPAQVTTWNLPTRPTKADDPRSKSFTGDSVELDAIPPRKLRTLAEQVIEQHVEEHQLGVLRVAEAVERELLERMAATINGRAESESH